ncbi:PREDICTED: myb/SANT-like DNA-binding domain-containing protein 3 isoform X1 [Papilio xuthus]|uniref:Regulatory protein zeste n=2 Tax=Papilio xuthus TaxID=66420 RepID=A0AAJ6YZG4_PAPXU|nr:PREDICTED: myb/SANT-like DNA-binding domain-containing protein 3 isoform X1 [Papilio xuthus]
MFTMDAGQVTMQDQQQQTKARKRVPNFTADEKALLAHLVKRRPIVQTKFTDAKTVSKKQAAWNLITQEFNSNANVHKRETLTLKRAWENMKAFTRKERANLLQTGGHPASPLQHEALLNLSDEDSSMMLPELENDFDSDSAILDSVEPNSPEPDPPRVMDPIMSPFLEVEVCMEPEPIENDTSTQREDADIAGPSQDCNDQIDKGYSRTPYVNQGYRPLDYMRRESILRVRYLERKKKLELELLKVQLETEQIKQRTALIEEEMAQVKLLQLKKSVEQHNSY